MVVAADECEDCIYCAHNCNIMHASAGVIGCDKCDSTATGGPADSRVLDRLSVLGRVFLPVGTSSKDIRRVLHHSALVHLIAGPARDYAHYGCL